eukprot:GFUD01044100.1.p1 GENE.GFUD01044100.1~~GFUD01044100.1.p1  ORF type:complete len:708 (+),score=166.26 GFUD01044100.1:153-2276(+)
MYKGSAADRDAESDAGPAEGQRLLQDCGRSHSADTLLLGSKTSANSSQEDFRSDNIDPPSGQDETKATDTGREVVEEKKQQQETKKDTKEEYKVCADCKPEPVCWDYLPEPVGRKWKQGKSWFCGDMSKTHLIWIKLIFFFQSASLVVLYPYLVIHMRSLGLSVEEVAVVNGVIPVADIIGPPLAGLVADKIGNFRLFMSGLTAISGAASLLLLLIPPKSQQTIFSPTELFCCTALDSSSRHLCTDSNTNTSYLAQMATLGVGTNESTVTCSAGNGNQAFSRLTPHMNMSSDMFTDNCMVFACEGQVDIVDANWEINLVFYIVLRAMIDVLRASSIMMFEGAVVITIKQLGGDYGLQKLFGTFGAIIWGPVSGQIIDMASSASGTANYAPVFYIFFVMRIICALLILKLNLSFKQPAKKVFKNLGKLIMKPHIFMFLIIFFLCGSVWGFLESYLFWFLEDLGSTKLTMGISLAIGTVAGIPLTIASGAIIRKLGNTNVIVLALSLYSMRLLGYSFINLPMESLIFEIFKPFGNSLLMIAAMTYAKNNADITTMASLEGVMGALYFGIGKALGSLIGGLAIDAIGVRNTFRCFSVTSLVAASVYLLFTSMWEKRKKDVQDVERSSDDKTDEHEEGISDDKTDVDQEDTSDVKTVVDEEDTSDDNTDVDGVLISDDKSVLEESEVPSPGLSSSVVVADETVSDSRSRST